MKYLSKEQEERLENVFQIARIAYSEKNNTLAEFDELLNLESLLIEIATKKESEKK